MIQTSCVGLLLLLAACGGDPRPQSDGGFDASAPIDAAPMDAASDTPPDTSAVDAPAIDGNVADAGTDAAVSCTEDMECGLREFCGPDDLCLPLGEPGAECEENSDCIDGLWCGPPRGTTKSLCVVGATTLELTRNPAAFDGQWIGLLPEQVYAGVESCTELACGDDECCNTCESQQVAGRRRDGIPLFMETGEPFRCSGTNCDWEEGCNLAPNSYYMVGIFTSGVGFTVHSYELEDPGSI